MITVSPNWRHHCKACQRGKVVGPSLVGSEIDRIPAQGTEVGSRDRLHRPAAQYSIVLGAFVAVVEFGEMLGPSHVERLINIVEYCMDIAFEGP